MYIVAVLSSRPAVTYTPRSKLMTVKLRWAHWSMLKLTGLMIPHEFGIKELSSVLAT
jgi:hypothetical protein